MENKKSVFETLSTINVSGKTEKKNGLTYLSWAYAWAEVCKVYPTATYKVYERDTQWGPVNYFTDGRTCWVKVGVTIEGLEHVEMLPVMNFKNQSIPLDKVTSCDANKAVQRAITKAISRHGLGLYIYTGEDLPECESHAQPAQPANKPIEKAMPKAPTQAQPVQQPVEKAVVQPQTTAQKPVKDIRPATAEMVDIIRKTVGEHGVTEDFICESYKICKLEDLRIYQFNHIKQNIEKLKTMFDEERKKRLADVVKNADICPQKQEKAEGEPIDLESLGLSTADLDALTEFGKVFS